MVRLGSVVTISSDQQKSTGEKIWLLNLDMVEQQTGDILSYNYVSADKLNGSILAFDSGNVLYSKLRPNLNKVVLPDRSGYATSEMLPLRPDPKVLTREYLAAYLRSDSFVQWASSKAIGAKMPRLSTNELLNKEIPLPELNEQHRIISIFAKISNLISLRRQQLVKLDELVKARFVEMFGDPVHNTHSLPVESFAKLGSLDRGRSQHRPRNDPELLNGPYPLIQTGEIANSGLYITSYKNTYSELGLRQSKMWNKGTLCITIAANIAQTAILGFNACFPDSVVGFIPNDGVSAIYIHYWFSFFQKILEEQAPQVAQKNINLKILSNLEVIIPSRQAQAEFTEFVNRTEECRLSIQKSLAQMETLKKAQMQKYFAQ